MAPYIRGLIEEKRACGFEYVEEEIWLAQFDRYWNETNGDSLQLSRENLEEWCMQRFTESAGQQRSRICVVRQLCFYVLGLGMECWIPDLKIRVQKPIVHVLSKEEIKELFIQIDLPPQCNRPASLRLSVEYGVMFRLILSCGLRNSEAASLRTENVCVESGTLQILGGKARKDRIVYVAPDVATMLGEYLEWHQSEFSGSTGWLFPARDPEQRMQKSTVSATFRRFWERTPFAQSCERRPTVHSLRHTYVVMRLNAWALQGGEVEALLPYLSRQLGHASPSETFYYYHEVFDAMRLIRSVDQTASRVIPEAPVL